MRGVAEQRAFDKLANSLDHSEIYFGLSQPSIAKFKRLVRSCRPNPQPSEFPDFYSQEAFVEHFQVTSSKESRKGSTQAKDESEFYKRNHEELKRQIAAANPNEPVVVSAAMVYGQHTYSYLVKSFKRNWDAHARKKENYLGSGKVGIFLVEYADFGLRMSEARFKDVEGLSVGDWPRAEQWGDYRLSRDKALLEYVSNNADGLQYVVFESGYLEVFEVGTICRYLSLLKNEYVVDGSPTLLSTKTVSLAVPEGGMQ